MKKQGMTDKEYKKAMEDLRKKTKKKMDSLFAEYEAERRAAEKRQKEMAERMRKRKEERKRRKK